MARFSGYWTTGGAVGHQVAGYTQSHEREAATIIASCHGNNGVGPDYANLLAGTHPAANTVRIATGGAIVDGKWFINRAAYDVNVPNAGAGTTRFDRVLLRATWAGFIVDVYVKTGDAVSPPALTETSETTYEIPLYIAEVTEVGVITLTDERAFAYTNTADIAPNAVTVAKLPQHGRPAVIGRLDTAGDADMEIIETAVNGRVLMRRADTLQFQTIDPDNIAANAVTAGKLANGAVDTTARLADDIVDDTKVGNRVPQIYRRQGDHADNWASKGTTTYTPGMVRIQVGAYSHNQAAAPTGNATITFPVAFSQVPLVFITAGSGLGRNHWSVEIASATDFTAYFQNVLSQDQTIIDFHWLAIGTE